MMPCGELKNIVVELGLEAINHSMDSSEKKVAMPLRMGGLLLHGQLEDKELKKHFSKKDAQLDKKNLVMITVLENLSDAPKIQVNHYWVFVANIKCRRFEVLDSMRTVVDKKLLQNAEKIRASIINL